MSRELARQSVEGLPATGKPLDLGGFKKERKAEAVVEYSLA